MRTANPRSAWIGILLICALAASEQAHAADSDDEPGVYFRGAALDSMSPQKALEYIDDEPGESSKLERAFPGAPPQVSHTIDDMLPITLTENECLECHDPENASAEEDIPFPKSHLQRPRMGQGPADGPMLWVVKGYTEQKSLVGTRHVCTMCHTPQAISVQTPASRFVREPSKR